MYHMYVRESQTNLQLPSGLPSAEASLIGTMNAQEKRESQRFLPTLGLKPLVWAYK